MNQERYNTRQAEPEHPTTCLPTNRNYFPPSHHKSRNQTKRGWRPGENVFDPARRKTKKNKAQRQRGGALSVATQNNQKLRAPPCTFSIPRSRRGPFLAKIFRG